MIRGLNIVLIMVGLLYPGLVYFGLQTLPLSTIALMLLALIFLRLAIKRDMSSVILAIGGSAGALSSLVFQSDLGVKSYPILISLSFAGIFAYSLVSPPSVIERIARLQESNLPKQGIQYTYHVTQVWLVFFLLNAAISVWTLSQSDKIWALYNGLISYLLMGSLFAGEFICRYFHKKRHNFN